jgi:acyl dehydratase
VHAHALRDDGSVVEGLYAAGNVSAPVMGHTYPGPGGTIGPAIAFGYLAALHIAGKACNVAQSFHMTEPPSVKFPGIDIELSRVLHASEAVSAPAPIPPSGTGRAVTKFTDIWDKGKAAVIWSQTTATTPGGTPLWTQKRSIFARGEGGFGGERGPSTSSEPTERAPDFELAIPVSPQQALLYRMCGDRNPLHSDPEFAAAAGFPRPILHGLCTYGMTCKAMVDALLDGDAVRVGSYGARFAGVVFPGETLKASVWKERDGFKAVITAPERNDAVALAGVELIPV